MKKKQLIARVLCAIGCAVLTFTSANVTSFAKNDDCNVEDIAIDEEQDESDALGVSYTGMTYPLQFPKSNKKESSEEFKVSKDSNLTSVDSDGYLNYIKNHYNDGSDHYYLGKSNIKEVTNIAKYYRDYTVGKSITAIGYGAMAGSVVGFTENDNVAYKNKNCMITVHTEAAGLEYISTQAFYQCTALKAADFRASTGLESIYDSAFSGCSSLKYLLLPSGVTSIASNAIPSGTQIWCAAGSTTQKTLINAGYSNIYNGTPNICYDDTNGVYINGLSQLKFTVSTSISPAGAGVVKVNNSNFTSGSYPANTTISVSYAPNAGYSCSSLSPNGSYKVTGNATIYASFKANNYTMSFNVNGGSNLSVGSKTVTYNAAVGTLPTASRRGYTLSGWNTAANGSGTAYTASTVYKVAGATTLYAQWKSDNQKYSVSLDFNGGTSGGGTYSVVTQAKYPAFPSATRTGYNLDGWYTAASGGAKIVPNSTVVTDIPATLYAHWVSDGKAYSVKLNANGGTSSVAAINVTTTKTYASLPTPSRKGYTFAGWYTAKDGGSAVNNSTVVTSIPSELFAHWNSDGKEYEVKLNANGGTCSNATAYLITQKACPTLPTPTRKGYTFNGWYTALNGGNQVKTGSTITDIPTDLYAHWNSDGKEYEVKLNANGGTCEAASIKVVAGKNYTELPTPTYAGYTFDGWYTAKEDGNKITEDTMVVDVLDEIFAHWTTDGSYNPDPINPDPVNPDPVNPDPVNPDPVNPDPINPINPDNKDDQDDVEPNNDEKTDVKPNDDVKPENEPTPNSSYNVKYTYSIANFTPTSKQSAKLLTSYENSVIKLPKLKAKGYTFVGWFVGDVKVREISKNVSVCKDDVTVNAVFAKKATKVKGVMKPTMSGNIIINTNGGMAKASLSQNGLNLNKAIKLSKATKPGYKFLGWFVGDTKVTKLDYKLACCQPYCQGGTIVCEAKWAPVEYVISFNKSRDGKGKMSKYYMYAGHKATLPECTFISKSGSVFNGWGMDKNFSSIISTSESFAPNEKFAKTKVKLYASWKANK